MRLAVDISRSIGRGGLPEASQLAALGVVLCLHRGGTALLDGWHRAATSRPCPTDDASAHEHWCFHDEQHQLCWQLHLLPETDFLAWDLLKAAFPAARGTERVERSFPRSLAWLSRCGLRPRWQMRAVRFHLVGDGGQLVFTEASTTRVSARWGHVIARHHGAVDRDLAKGCPTAG